MKRFALLSAILAALFMTACSSCGDSRVAAAAPSHSRVYTPPCNTGVYARPADDLEYTPSECNSFQVLGEQLSKVRCPLRGAGLPGLDCSSPGPIALVPEAPAPRVAALTPAPTCDPANLPKDAKPGDVFCCVFVQPPAAAPVKVAEARTEWQRIDCGPTAGECWHIVEIPPVFSAPPPPPGYWEWRLTSDCQPPVVKFAAPPCTPKGE